MVEKKEQIDYLKEKTERQVIKGRINDIDDIEKSLPPGVDVSMVESYLGKDGHWWWHLRPEYIKNKKKKEEWRKEEEMWRGFG